MEAYCPQASRRPGPCARPRRSLGADWSQGRASRNAQPQTAYARNAAPRRGRYDGELPRRSIILPAPPHRGAHNRQAVSRPPAEGRRGRTRCGPSDVSRPRPGAFPCPDPPRRPARRPPSAGRGLPGGSGRPCRHRIPRLRAEHGGPPSEGGCCGAGLRMGDEGDDSRSGAGPERFPGRWGPRGPPAGGATRPAGGAPAHADRLPARAGGSAHGRVRPFADTVARRCGCPDPIRIGWDTLSPYRIPTLETVLENLVPIYGIYVRRDTKLPVQKIFRQFFSSKY